MLRTQLAGVVCTLLLSSGPLPAGAQDIAAGQSKHGYCASCHGIEGRSFKPHYPILAGLSENYLLVQLNDFKDGRRRDPNMDAIVPQLSAQDMRDLAAFFASVTPGASRFKPDLEKAARGRAKAALEGCAGCHPRGKLALKATSRIDGQHRDYLAKQLRDFRDGRRANDGGVMHRIAQSLTDADIDALSEHFAGMH